MPREACMQLKRTGVRHPVVHVCVKRYIKWRISPVVPLRTGVTLPVVCVCACACACVCVKRYIKWRISPKELFLLL
jgi:hypothetical protein